jgi:hypothetical protein
VTTYPPRWRVERRAVASSTLLQGMRENQVTKRTKQEHQHHFYIQGVSKMLGQIQNWFLHIRTKKITNTFSEISVFLV